MAKDEKILFKDSHHVYGLAQSETGSGHIQNSVPSSVLPPLSPLQRVDRNCPVMDAPNSRVFGLLKHPGAATNTDQGPKVVVTLQMERD